MAFSRQNVKFTENERIDLPDFNALTTLRDEELAIYVRSLFAETSSSNGFVLRGFRGAGVGNLLFNIASEISVAIDADGVLITRDAVGTVGLSLTPNNTSYIMLYYLPTDSNPDARRFIDSATGLETVQTVATRTSKFAGFFVNTTGFVSSSSINGVIRKLIPLYTVVTGASTISRITDNRPLWGDPGTGETQTQQTALAFTDIRVWLRDICEKIKAISGTSLYSINPQRTLSAVDSSFLLQHDNNGIHTDITGLSLSVIGSVTANDGVYGIATKTQAGVSGTGGPDGGPGVVGLGQSRQPGVIGIGGSDGGVGVRGFGQGEGAGVSGESGGSGPGVRGGVQQELGIGVEGTSGTVGGIGVRGIGQGIGTGVSGTGGPDGGAGVSGETSSNSNNSIGVRGSALSSGSGIGVLGFGGNVSGIGVQGTGRTIGVEGIGEERGIGVQGEGGPDNGVGVRGVGRGIGTGVQGEGGPNNGDGVVGYGSGKGTGVQGASNNVGVHGIGYQGTDGTGVFCEAQGTGSPIHIGPQNNPPTARGVGSMYVTTSGVLKIWTADDRWVSVGTQI